MASDALIPFPFYQRLSARERVLLLVVAGTLFALANLVAVSALTRTFSSLRRACEEQSDTLKVQRLFARDQPMWNQRMAWLRTNQPVLASRDRAGASLFDQVQQLARASGVIITNQQIKPVLNAAAESRSSSADYQAVSVEMDTQSDWGGLSKFLYSVQQPKSFLVIDLTTIRSDTDPATIKGHFQISKWYAPGVH